MFKSVPLISLTKHISMSFLTKTGTPPPFLFLQVKTQKSYAAKVFRSKVHNFYIVVLLPIFNHSCHSAVVPIAPGVVTQIINTLLFLLPAHRSSSQSNILITALPLMLLRSGTNSLLMCAVQHQLPPSERSLKLTCLQKHIPHSLSSHPVSPWYDLAMSSD